MEEKGEERPYWGRDGRLARAKRRYYQDRRSDCIEHIMLARLEWMKALYQARVSIQPEAKQFQALAFRRVLWCVWYLTPQVRFFKKQADYYHWVKELSSERCQLIGEMLEGCLNFPLLWALCGFRCHLAVTVYKLGADKTIRPLPFQFRSR